MLKSWNAKFGKRAHPYSIVGWTLSVFLPMHENVKNNLTGDHRLEIKKGVTRLHAMPCANPDPDMADMLDNEVIDLFWVDFKCFVKKTDMPSNEARWMTADVFKGSSWL